MAQTKHEIQSLLSAAAAQPRHRFGQNFMIDGNLVRIVADAGGIVPGDVVIEVGAGTGTLTEEILARGADVVAVEIDHGLAELLLRRFGANPAFGLIEGDALAGKHELNPAVLDAIGRAKSEGKTVRLVANLPYNIASPLIVDLLVAGVDLLAFTVQREVAQRIRAAAGSGDYGALSINVQVLSEAEVLRVMPRQAFWPMPKIESALVRLVRKDRLGLRAGAFRGFVQALFSSRRKMLRNALEQAGADSERVVAATGLSGGIRPENISPQDCLRMFDAAFPNAAGAGTGSV